MGINLATFWLKQSVENANHVPLYPFKHMTWFIKKVY